MHPYIYNLLHISYAIPRTSAEQAHCKMATLMTAASPRPSTDVNGGQRWSRRLRGCRRRAGRASVAANLTRRVPSVHLDPPMTVTQSSGRAGGTGGGKMTRSIFENFHAQPKALEHGAQGMQHVGMESWLSWGPRAMGHCATGPGRLQGRAGDGGIGGHERARDVPK